MEGKLRNKTNPARMLSFICGMRTLFLLVCLAMSQLAVAQNPEIFSFRVAKLKYEGGGDWYSNPSALPNLLEYINRNSTTRIAPQEDVVEPGSSQIFQYPYVYMTGHGNVRFSDAEIRNLRSYLISGGFLHIDDNYGMDQFVRRELKRLFPELELVPLPFGHPIYRQPYPFANGLPKIHEHDNKPPQGLALIWQNRPVVFYTYECDLGDGWEDPEVHQDPAEVRELALRMGMNIVLWAIQN